VPKALHICYNGKVMSYVEKRQRSAAKIFSGLDNLPDKPCQPSLDVNELVLQ